MQLSEKTVETLVDLVEIKLSSFTYSIATTRARSQRWSGRSKNC